MTTYDQWMQYTRGLLMGFLGSRGAISSYPVDVFYNGPDGGYIAVVWDLPGCSAFGKTEAEAVAEIDHAVRVWQRAAIKAGNPVPSP
jgi:predicted RNase H-like HicB family nuclease